METSAVGRMVDNLAMQLDTYQMTSPEPVARREPAPVIPVPPPKVQMEEPLDLGGAEAPMIEEPVASPAVTVRVQTTVALPAKKRRFGLFGLRRPEREDYQVEPRLEAPMPTAPRQHAPAIRASASAPSSAQAQAAPAARASAEAPREQAPSPDDLFAGVAEDDRFEIPAFLRRQANTGG